MSTIDENGVTLDDLATAKAAVIERFKAAYGDNIKTDDQSIFGILATIIGEIIADQNDLIREAINARNPQAASGTNLANICSFNGISRRSPEYSTVVLTCEAYPTGTTIPAGSLVQDPSNSAVEFSTDSELVLAADATGTVSATATTAGAVEASAGTLTKIVNPVFGWLSVINASAAVAGRAVETDSDLRARRKYVSRQTGLQSLPKVYAALTEIDEIGRVTLRENCTNYVDSVGQLPHSVWAICQGGSDEDIAIALFNNVAAGIMYHGESFHVLHDDTLDKDYTIYFDRPSEVECEIELTIAKGVTYPADGDDQIKNAIIDYFNGAFIKDDGETDNGFSIGENVEYFRLVTPINSIGGHAIKTFKIGELGGTLGARDIEIGMKELATIAAENITITTY